MSRYNFSQEDKDFLHELNGPDLPVESRIYTTAQHGYLRNLDRDKLQGLENIYKRVVDNAFVLCFHCSTEVLNLVLKLYGALEKHEAAQPTPAKAEDVLPEITEHQSDEQPEPTPAPAKKSRSKKQ